MLLAKGSAEGLSQDSGSLPDNMQPCSFSDNFEQEGSGRGKIREDMLNYGSSYVQEVWL